MKLFKIEIAKDTFIYIDKRVHDAIKKSNRAAKAFPCRFFTTEDVEIMKRIKEELE